MGIINKLFSKKTGEKSSDPIAVSQKNQNTGLKFNDEKKVRLNGLNVVNHTHDPKFQKRKEVYLELKSQKLLRYLLASQTSEIFPTFDLYRGFRYEIVDDLLENTSSQETQALLERLTDLEILEKTLFETVTSCPSCASPSITLHFHCPKCSSNHITKTSLTEHIPCGNIDERDKFIETNSLVTCPKCGKELVEGNYRDLGRWYVCKKCTERFEKAELDLVCRQCSNQFSVEKAVIREISKYYLNRELEPEIKQHIASFESIKVLLTELGFNVKIPTAVLSETSGIEHSFSLIAEKGGEKPNIIILEHAVGDPEVSESQFIMFLYKILEVKVHVPIFVAIPKLSDTAKKIAQNYNILVIEGIPQHKKQIAMLKDEIQTRLKESVLDLPPLPEIQETSKPKLEKQQLPTARSSDRKKRRSSASNQTVN